MPTATQTADLSVALQRQIQVLADLARAVSEGTDSPTSAAKIAALALELVPAERRFFIALSLAHAANLHVDPDAEVWGITRLIQPNAPSETAVDFAGWAKGLARERTCGPIQPLSAAE